MLAGCLSSSQWPAPAPPVMISSGLCTARGTKRFGPALQMPPCYKCIHVENTNGRAYGPPVTARRMELSAGVISLPRHSDIMEQLQLQLQHDLITDAGKQVSYSAMIYALAWHPDDALMSGTGQAQPSTVAWSAAAVPRCVPGELSHNVRHS